jgi:hypothetical protein
MESHRLGKGMRKYEACSVRYLLAHGHFTRNSPSYKKKKPDVPVKRIVTTLKKSI